MISSCSLSSATVVVPAFQPLKKSPLAHLVTDLFIHMAKLLDQKSLGNLATGSRVLFTHTREAQNEIPALYLTGNLAAIHLAHAFSQYPRFCELTITGITPQSDPQLAPALAKGLQHRPLHKLSLPSCELSGKALPAWIIAIQQVGFENLESLDFSEVRLVSPSANRSLIEALIPLLSRCQKIQKLSLSRNIVLNPFETQGELLPYASAILSAPLASLIDWTFPFSLNEALADNLLRKIDPKTIRSCNLDFIGEKISVATTWRILCTLPLSEMSSIRLSGLSLTTEMYFYVAARLARNQVLEDFKISAFTKQPEYQAAIALIGSIHASHFHQLAFPIISKDIAPFLQRQRDHGWRYGPLM